MAAVRWMAALGRHGTTVLFGSIFLGLLLPSAASFLRPTLPAFVFLLLFISLLRVDWTALGQVLRRPFLIGGLVVGLMIAAPVVTWVLLLPLPIPEGLRTGIVLMAAGPPILGATAIAFLLRLDGAVTLVVCLCCTLLTPITVPPVALILLGLDLDISLLSFMGRLGILVGVSLLLAVAVRRKVGSVVLARNHELLDGLVVLCMVGFAVAIMEGVTDTAMVDPQRVALWTLAGLAANPLLQVLGYAGTRFLGRNRGLTVGLMMGNRNMGLLLAALPAGADPGVALFFAVAQIPMYTLPALQKRLYQRIART